MLVRVEGQVEHGPVPDRQAGVGPSCNSPSSLPAQPAFQQSSTPPSTQQSCRVSLPVQGYRVNRYTLQRMLVICRAYSEQELQFSIAEKLVKTAPEDASDSNWLPAFAPEDLPKGACIPASASGFVEQHSADFLLIALGTRKEVNIAGEAVLLFWYRNEIFAIEAR